MLTPVTATVSVLLLRTSIFL